MFWNAHRYFELEHLRQRAITWPKRAGRLAGHQLEKVIEESGDGHKISYKPRFNLAYEYYERGETRKSIYLTLGLRRLTRAAGKRLEDRFMRQRDFWVRTDPDGELPGCLTPGPQVMGWAYLLRAVLPLVIVHQALYWQVVPTVYLLSLVGLLFFWRLSNVQYQNGRLEASLEPINNQARPQVQTKVIEAIPLPEAIALKEKLPG